MTCHYQTLARASESEFKDKGSRFLGFAFPIASEKEFKTQLLTLYQAHPKAAHACFAWRLGLTQDYFRVNDHGEPSGSAGRPILGRIDSLNLTDCAVVVIRYFGGALLGVPGLIHAYKATAQLALADNEIIKRPVLAYYTLRCAYHHLSQVQHKLNEAQAQIVERDFQMDCMLRVAIPLQAQEAALKALSPYAVIESAPSAQ